MDTTNHKITCVDRSGLNDHARKFIPQIWGKGKWIPAVMDGHAGELYAADDGLCIFLTHKHVPHSIDSKKLEITGQP